MNSKLRGETDPENIWLWENKANFYRDKGETEKAKEINQKALAIAEVIYGEESIRLSKY
jgi:hypothetical protein